jgi:hypothetical protein
MHEHIKEVLKYRIQDSTRIQVLMHLSMLGRRGGRRGKGAGFDIQTKFCVKFPTPGIQVLVKSIVPRGNKNCFKEISQTE